MLFVKDFSFIDRTSREGWPGSTPRHWEALHRQANAWMLLCDGNDSGPASGAVILPGDDAILALVTPVDDATTVDWYAGSEEAAVDNGHKYRIKDFTAFYLGGSLQADRVPRATADRDREIAQLRDALRSSGK